MTNLYNEKMKSRLQKAEQKNADMKEYLAPKRENKQLLESVIERIKNYRKTP